LHCFSTVGVWGISAALIPLLYLAFSTDSKYWRDLDGGVPSPSQWGDEKPLLSISDYFASQCSPRRCISYGHLGVGRLLGRGAQASVYEATVDSGSLVAVKMFHCPVLTPEVIEEFGNEIAFMDRMGRHPNIVTFLGFSICPPAMCVIMELCANGSLRSFLFSQKERSAASPPLLPFAQFLHLARGCSDAVAHLHSLLPLVIHRDITSTNFLVTSNCCVKLSDFGLARDTAGIMDDIVGTVQYMAPEVARKEVCTTGSDVYRCCLIIASSLHGLALPRPRTPTLFTHRVSLMNTVQPTESEYLLPPPSLGVVIWEIFTLQTPFSEKFPAEALEAIVNNETPCIPAAMPIWLTELLQTCWRDAMQRPTAASVLEVLSTSHQFANESLGRTKPICYWQPVVQIGVGE